jgi:hypothetical protein
MAHQPAQATIAFSARVPVEDDARRRRLQARMGCTVRDLISRALAELERALDAEALDASPTTDREKKMPRPETGAKVKKVCSMYSAGRSPAT